jgi:predicted nucleic acid-binding protein
MDRLFLDANILFSAAYRPDAGLLQLWRIRHVELYSSRYALAEAEINLSDHVQRKRLKDLSGSLRLVESRSPMLPRGIVLPQKDAPILIAAIEAHATHLLTGDVRHFGPYFGRKIGGVTILLPAEYLKRRP